MAVIPNDPATRLLMSDENPPMGEVRVLMEDPRAYVFLCPHCAQRVVLFEEELACLIYRHGWYVTGPKQTAQVPPHAPKDLCDRLVAEKRMVFDACAGPFQLVRDETGRVARVQVCDYI